ncbi:MAG TPA: hypothetical protein VEF71_06370 [Streptosporangiaceae bacterium]|nr:hypothetical protein [Streptosporangiaceae bacterium]
MNGQAGRGVPEVAAEHGGKRALAVVTLLGGGEGGALPCAPVWPAAALVQITSSSPSASSAATPA